MSTLLACFTMIYGLNHFGTYKTGKCLLRIYFDTSKQAILNCLSMGTTLAYKKHLPIRSDLKHGQMQSMHLMQQLSVGIASNQEECLSFMVGGRHAGHYLNRTGLHW